MSENFKWRENENNLSTHLTSLSATLHDESQDTIACPILAAQHHSSISRQLENNLENVSMKEKDLTSKLITLSLANIFLQLR